MAITLETSIVLRARLEHGTFEVDAADLRTLRDLFKDADKRQLLGKRTLGRLVAGCRHNGLTVLHNGRRLDLPRELKNPVADGDVVELLTPVVGG